MCSLGGRWLTSDSILVNMSTAQVVVRTFSNISTVVLGEGPKGNWSLYPKPRVSASIHVPWHVDHDDHHHQGPMWPNFPTCGSLIVLVSIVPILIVIMASMALWGQGHVLPSTVTVACWTVLVNDPHEHGDQSPNLIVGAFK